MAEIVETMARAANLTKVQREFLGELAYENPIPAEPWKDRDNWDPMFLLSVIDAMERRGLIEVRGPASFPTVPVYRFRPRHACCCW